MADRLYENDLLDTPSNSAEQNALFPQQQQQEQGSTAQQYTSNFENEQAMNSDDLTRGNRHGPSIQHADVDEHRTSEQQLVSNNISVHRSGSSPTAVFRTDDALRRLMTSEPRHNIVLSSIERGRFPGEQLSYGNTAASASREPTLFSSNAEEQLMLRSLGMAALGPSEAMIRKTLRQQQETSVLSSPLYPNNELLLMVRQKKEEISLLRGELARRRALARLTREPLLRSRDEVSILREELTRRRAVERLSREESNSFRGGTASRKQRRGSSPPHQPSHSSASQHPQAQPQASLPPVRRAQDDGILTLSLPSDTGVLSDYQLLIRETIKVFAAEPQDVRFLATTQGRNANVTEGQVGFCCKYCAHRPLHWRGRGAVYFPGKLSRVYQTAQNMASNHFLSGCCDDMPDAMKERFVNAAQRKPDQKSKRSKRSAGKEYWESSCRSLGLEDREGRLGVWFRRV